MTSRRAIPIIRALTRWKPPLGVMRSIDWNPDLGELHLTLMYGGQAADHPVLADCPRVAVRCAAEWATELLCDVQAEARDKPEPEPDWLNNTFAAIDYVERFTPLVEDAAPFTKDLLRTIGADCYPEPVVTGTERGGLELWWTQGSRRLIVRVQSKGQIAIQAQDGAEWDATGVSGKYCHPSVAMAAEWLRGGHVGPLGSELQEWLRPARQIDCTGGEG